MLGDGAGGDGGVCGEEAGDHGFFLGSGDDPEDVAAAVEDGVGEGHAAAVLVDAGEGDFGILDVADGVAWDERGGVAVGAEAEVGEVEDGGMPAEGFEGGGVVAAGLVEVCGVHWHGVDVGFWNGGVGEEAFAEVGEVAVLVAIGSDAFVDLDDVERCPWDVFMGEGAEHLPRGAASADGHDKASAGGDGVAGFGGDDLCGASGDGVGGGECFDVHGLEVRLVRRMRSRFNRRSRCRW